MPREPLTEQRFDEIIGALLRYGVGLAAVVVALGGVWYLFQSGFTTPSYHVFRGAPANLRSLRGIVKSLGDFQPRDVIQFGLLLLIATPVARVAFSVAAFWRRQDRTYVVITLIVLAVLLYSLLGKHSG
jgi:uncharacterized membrane protein